MPKDNEGDRRFTENNDACLKCPASLACVAGLIEHYYRCVGCKDTYVQAGGKSMKIDPKKCRLVSADKQNRFAGQSWCNTCGRKLRPGWYNEDGDAIHDGVPP